MLELNRIQAKSWKFIILNTFFLLVLHLQTINAEQCLKTEDIVRSIRGRWTYKCVNQKCHKTLYKGEQGSQQISLNVCKLKCGDPPGALWPLPNGHVSIHDRIIPINPNNINIESVSANNKDIDWKVGKLFLELRKSFLTRIVSEATTRDARAEGNGLIIRLQVHDTISGRPTLDMDESYHLHVDTVDNKIVANIEAQSYFGSRHGLETLSQLVAYDDVSNSLVMPAKLEIRDRPVYKYRGLVLDTARNFIPIEDIRRTIDAMATVKLNIFHWHITDSHSFPMESKTFPNLTIYGAYGPDKIYTQKEIRDLVEFAAWKGVKIIPEFDAPAHTGEGWQWAPPGTLICLNDQPWYDHCVEPPCGQLNPVNENVYKILSGIQTDMHEMFDLSDVFHMGGDEVQFKCWNSSKEVVEFIESKGWNQSDSKSMFRIWDIFQSRAYSSLQQVTNKSPQAILWTSTLTEREDVTEFLDTNKYIVQIWTTGTDAQIKDLAKKGYRMIFSNYDALYLDCGFGGWVSGGNNWCSPYKPWQTIYSNDMVQLVKQVTGSEYKTEMTQLIYGAAAALWTEQVDEQSLDGRVWPRLAALAERLWTNPSTPWQDAEFRMLAQRERLVRMNIEAEALEPEWCRQHEGDCPDLRSLNRN
ncbi:chitooligosaccharidolytic beta-N-acetylglucosaminidase [Nilaparvata lugens]|uniref:chitooligosaccharidolytic beta-N-acetylglucosaminidase n=1 Tax=Nilaparvata lugens TaxID=108931 RepID=UPI00193E29C1|nr:chitooligosaccharidolytic beta-N-acetylglucosaminidase [Nilaparvata lugens]